MDFDFNQIGEMLGGMSEEELQNLQDAAASLFSSFGEGQPSDGHDGRSGPEPQGQASGGGFDGGFGSMFTPELLARLSQMMQRMNGRDPRTDLILALKPHLSQRRQHRAEQAVQMMKMLELMPALQDAMK